MHPAVSAEADDLSEIAWLPRAEFAFPGPLRDALVAAILAGQKTATVGLLPEYEREQEPLPEIGGRAVVVDSQGRGVAVIETTEVRVVRVADVDLAFAIDEGEGFTSVLEWRAAHERFWHGSEMREVLGEPAFEVNDDTLVVAERFRLVRRL
jgi:uncharacterized protein YhfF